LKLLTVYEALVNTTQPMSKKVNLYWRKKRQYCLKLYLSVMFVFTPAYIYYIVKLI